MDKQSFEEIDNGINYMCDDSSKAAKSVLAGLALFIIIMAIASIL